MSCSRVRPSRSPTSPNCSRSPRRSRRSRGVARLYGKRVREMRAASEPTICDAFIGGLVPGQDNPNLGITLKFPVQEDGSYRIEPGGARIAQRVLSERETQA